MKSLSKQLTILFMGLFIITSCTTTPHVPEGEYLIRGHFDNLPDTTTINLSRWNGDLGITVATDTVINGYFELRGEIEPEGEYRFMMIGDDGFESRYYEIWLSSGSFVEIESASSMNADWVVKSKSQMQRAHSKYLGVAREEQLAIGRLSIERNEVMAKVYQAIREGTDYSQYKPIVDTLRALIKEPTATLKIKQLEYLKSAKIDDYWIYRYMQASQFLYITDPDSEEVALIRELYPRIPQSRLESEDGKKITAYLNPPAVVGEGDMLPDVEFFDPEGESHSLAQFKGKYILVDFFSRGCGPCIAALPEMQEVSEVFAEKLEVVSISSDNKEVWLEFLTSDQSKDSTYHHWNELVGVPVLYRALNKGSIPTFMIVDPEGRIVKVWNGYGNGIIKRELNAIFNSK